MGSRRQSNDLKVRGSFPDRIIANFAKHEPMTAFKDPLTLELYLALAL